MPARGRQAAFVVLTVAIIAGCASLRVGIGGAGPRSDRLADVMLAPSADAGATSPGFHRSVPTGPTTAPAHPPSTVNASEPASGPTRPDPTSSPQVRFAPRIGYISLDEDLAYGRAVSESIRDATSAAGLELVECDPDWTAERVLDCAQRLGDIGIDGLLSFQPFPELGTQVCDLTDDVPTVGIVFDQGPCQVSRLEVDQAEAGRLAGERVGRFAKQRWDCEISAFVSLESSDADPDGRARMDGYRTGYEEYCPMPRRSPVLDGADRLITAKTAMADLLADLRGRRIVVVGINEDSILGAMAAAEETGRAEDLWYSGQLADRVMRRHIACDRRYLASVAQFPERYGDELVPILVDAMAGRTVAPVVEAPLELVTADNVRDLFPDTPHCGRPDG
jgi:ribose transport system substrate-binding protein